MFYEIGFIPENAELNSSTSNIKSRIFWVGIFCSESKLKLGHVIWTIPIFVFVSIFAIQHVSNTCQNQNNFHHERHFTNILSFIFASNRKKLCDSCFFYTTCLTRGKTKTRKLSDFIEALLWALIFTNLLFSPIRPKLVMLLGVHIVQNVWLS